MLMSCDPSHQPRTLEASAKEPPLVQTPKVQSAPERIEEKPQIKESEARTGSSSSTSAGCVESTRLALGCSWWKVVKEAEAEEPSTQGQKDEALEAGAGAVLLLATCPSRHL